MFKINIAGCITLIVALLWISQGSTLAVPKIMSQQSEDTIRQTKSNEIRQYMNESADPCEDFYEFACGNYANSVPPTQKKTTVFNVATLLQSEKTRKIKEMLMAEEDVNDTDVNRKVKDFYKSCLNFPPTLSTFRDKMISVLEEFGPVPFLRGDQWQERNFDWTKTLSQMIQKSAIMPIIDIDVMPHLDDKNINVVVISESVPIFLQRVYYVDESFSDKLDVLVLIIARKLKDFMGVEPQLALRVATEIKDFEVALAQGMLDPKLGLTPKQFMDLINTEQLQNKYSEQWDLKKVLRDSLGFVPNELYLETQYVENALKTIMNTPKRVVANYMFYRYIEMFTIYLSPTASMMEDECLSATIKHFYKNLTNMFYHKYFNQEMEKSVNHMWREMKEIFGNILTSPRIDWIREDTRKEASYKLKAMKMFIHSYENENFAQELDQMDLNDLDYVQNIKSILMMYGRQHREKIHKTHQHMAYKTDVVLSPFYLGSENAVYFTASILQSHLLWSNSYPNAYNFATLGSYVGHEIIHGFDDQGRQFDSKGYERDWWDPDSANNFRERTQCFINQYKQYNYEGIFLPESPLQAENIADNGGIRLAYAAYMNWYANAERNNQNLDSESFPGFNYTNSQLFFISYGHAWCTAIDHDNLVWLLTTDSHTPDKFRIIGSLSNYDEFSKAFNCPKGSKMNPINKCEIY